MSKYRIMSWTPIISSDNPNIYIPMIYVKPDAKFLEIVRGNYNVVNCKISGTNMVIDGHNIPGVVTKSSQVPNYRPNFYDATGYYSISLISNWYGYPNPDTLGTVEISSSNPEIKQEKSPEDSGNSSNDLAQDSSNENRGDSSHNGKQNELSLGNDMNIKKLTLSNPIVMVMIVILSVLLILGLITFFKKHRNNK